MERFEHEYESLPTDQQGGFCKFLEILANRGRSGWQLCGFEYGQAFFVRCVNQLQPEFPVRGKNSP